jgi:hypothetical protein
MLYVLVFFAIRGTRGDRDVVLPNWKCSHERVFNSFTMRDLRPSIAEEVEATRQKPYSHNQHFLPKTTSLNSVSDEI